MDAKRLALAATCAAVAIALCMPIGAMMATEDWTYGSDGCIMTVDLGGGLRASALRARNVRVLAEYDSFALVEISSSKAAELEMCGYAVREMADRTAIHLSRYSFDTSGGEPDLPSSQRLAAYPSGSAGLYLVQMIGPVKESWLDTLQSLGARIVSYVPNYAYVVRMTPESAAAAIESPNVQWLGIFQPAYKILPCVSDCSIIVTVLDSSTAGATLSSLAEMGSIWSVDYSECAEAYQVCIDVRSLGEIDAIASLPDVMCVDDNFDDASVRQQHSETEAEIVGGNWTARTPYGGAGSYVNLLGWTGSGVQVSICDGGIGNGASGHPDFQDRYDGGIDYKDAKRNLDGSLATSSGDAICSHGTHMAGLVGGDTSRGTKQTYPTSTTATKYYVGNGVAPNCTLVSQRLFSEVGNYAFNSADTQANWEMFFGDSLYLGTEICACSFGLDEGTYSARSSFFDHAVRDCNVTVGGDQMLSITSSVGNGGPSKKVTEPSTAKNIIAVGGTETCYIDATTYSNGGAANSDNPEDLYSGSNSGTSDNRIKPDAVAPAQDTLSTGSQFDGSSYYDGRAFKNGTVDYRYYWNAGTSFSSPNGAGSLAVVYQWYKARYGIYPSPAMAKALVLGAAKDITGSGSATDIPNYREGWGRIYLPDVITPATSVLKRDQTANLLTGQTFYLNVTCQNTGLPLKVMLAYTDYQAATGAAKAAVNNLDLRVTAPNNDIYYGNSFTNGRTVVNGYAGNTNFGYDWDDDNNHYDDHNNVEAVFIQTPTTGTYRIEVIAANVASDAVAAAPGINQNFALVVNNVLNGDTDVSPPSFAGVKSAQRTTGGSGYIGVVWDAAVDWSNPITYMLWRFDHNPTPAEVNSTGTTWTGTALSYIDTACVTGTTYYYVVRARDSLANTGYNMIVASCLSENAKFLQVQSPSAGYRNLNTDAMESSVQTVSTGVMSAIGDYMVDTASGKWLSPVFATATDLSGTWSFNVYGMMNNRYTHGYIYAVAKRHSDGATLFTSGYDDEDVSLFTTSHHQFRWQHAVSGVTIPAGDRYYIEIWVHVTAIPSTPTTRNYDYASGTHTALYLDSDDTPPYVIGSTVAPTLSQIATSDDIRSLSRDPGTRNWISLQCRMYVTETSSQIDEVEMRWEGKGDPANDNNMGPVEDQGYLCFYVWNFTGSKWLKVSQCSMNRSSDSTLRYVFTNRTPGFNQWSNYIGAGNEFRWIAHYKVMDMTMLTDYVSLTVRKSSSATGQFTMAFDNGATPSCVVQPGAALPPMASWHNVTGLVAGWNLVSVSINAADTRLPYALTDTFGATRVAWTRVMWCNPATPTDPWKQYNTGWNAALNDLKNVDNKIGVWLFVTTAADGILNLGGTNYSTPATTAISMMAGWNMVGFPSDDTTYTVANLKADTGATIVEGFDIAQTYKTIVLADGVALAAGRAYWVRTASDVVWTKLW